MKRWAAGGAAGLLGLTVLVLGFLWGQLNYLPPQDLALPDGLIALSDPAGQHALGRSERADHDGLMRVFQTQEKASWCGVASAVSVLNAGGATLDQDGFFTPEASAVRGYWSTTFGGMPLSDLRGMLEAHGVQAEVWYAEDESLATFRSAVRENLSHPEDWIVVNYDRGVLGQSGSGHISPLSAYDAAGDRVLLLDTASYKYRPHWVPVPQLFAAMQTPDSESGLSRGWVEVGE